MCVKIKVTRDVHDVEVGVAGLLIAVLWDGVGDDDGREEIVSSARRDLTYRVVRFMLVSVIQKMIAMTI